jgi:chromatin remodeling complex protein RSC6
MKLEWNKYNWDQMNLIDAALLHDHAENHLVGIQNIKINPKNERKCQKKARLQKISAISVEEIVASRFLTAGACIQRAAVHFVYLFNFLMQARYHENKPKIKNTQIQWDKSHEEKKQLMI